MNEGPWVRWRLGVASPRLGLVSSSIGDRKADHLALCAEEDVGFRQRTTLLEWVRLVHDALPDMATAAIDTSVTLFGKKLRAPLIIASMTGGTEEAGRINRELRPSPRSAATASASAASARCTCAPVRARPTACGSRRPRRCCSATSASSRRAR